MCVWLYVCVGVGVGVGVAVAVAQSVKRPTPFNEVVGSMKTWVGSLLWLPVPYWVDRCQLIK